jgi:hypothetical protein
VQRNLTPGGDKNGADINLALDALEMAFTHPHINAYVIVGGDSDFITLVEKLKQYDKQIFVVGGRAFTSYVMQRNCHEFIAYENLITGPRKSSSDRRQSGPVAQAPIDQVVPLVRRALKVLSDREVSPQLGLLKSTLLQLDSTFSERTYGVSSFRDFADKLAAAGHVVVREMGRNVVVELPHGTPATSEVEAESAPPPPQQERREPRESHSRGRREEGQPQGGRTQEPRLAEGIREIRRLFQSAPNPPRWPMYVRQAKQFMRNVDSAFDERKFGYSSIVDLLRAAGREGLFRVERDRQGVIRLFPGNVMQQPADDEAATAAAVPGAPRPWQPGDDIPDIHDPDRPSVEVVEGDVVQEMDTPEVVDAQTSPAEDSFDRAADSGATDDEEPGVAKRGRGRGSRAAKSTREPKSAKAPRTRKPAAGGGAKAAKAPRGSRSRKATTTPAE